VVEGDRLTRALHDLLHERFGVEHTTIQLESDRSPLIQVGPRDSASPDGSAATASDAAHPTDREGDARRADR
jgi:hypothetical protein